MTQVMARLTLAPPSMDGVMTEGRQRRNSYLEVLSSVSSDLEFVASDLRKAPTPFKASSPKSPLAVSASLPVAASPQDDRVFQIPQADRYQHLRVSRNYSFGTNNNASTVSTTPPALHYSQLPISRGGDDTGLPTPPYYKSLGLPVSPIPHHHLDLHGNDSMELSLLTRLVHTKPIWFLPNTQRTAAIHYLQGQPVGTFVVCQSRDKDNLVLTMKHPGKGTGLYIEKLPIQVSQNGLKLSTDSDVYPSIEDLILHHLHRGDSLPCKLALPSEIMAARNIRALQSLALFEEEFWTRSLSSPGLPLKPEEQKKDALESVDSQVRWTAFPQPSAEAQGLLKPSEPPAVPPQLPPSKEYIIMQKHPLVGQHPSAAAKTAAMSQMVNSAGQGAPLRVGELGKVLAENRQLHKSWSFDDKNNPFRWSKFGSPIVAKDGQYYESIDDTLLARSGRQPMRCSTQSQQEFLLQNLGNYPPPLHSPPPPPQETVFDSYPSVPPKTAAAPPLIQRGSAEYYKPFEPTRQGHHPPSAFGFESLLSSQEPPPLPPRSTNRQSQGAVYQVPCQGLLLPTPSSHYSSPTSLPKPSGPEGNRHVEFIASPEKRTSLEGDMELSQQHKPASGLVEGQENLAPVLQPSVSAIPPSLSREQNPLFEFDPLFTSKPEETPPPTTPLPAQDVFSLEAPSPQPASPKVKSDATIGILLNFTVDESEEDETEKPKIADKTSGTDYSSDDWDQIGYEEEGEEEEEEEEDRLRGDRSSSTGDNLSNHSSDAHLQIGETMPEPIKMTPQSDDDEDDDLHQENIVDNLSEVRLSQTKKVKKLKKKKLSNLSKFQKYVMRGKTKRKKKKHGDPAEEIQEAIHKLASNKSSYFSMMMSCFVQNIKDKDEREKPNVLIRNLRQFMSGMKNYLFNRREPEVDAAMDKHYHLTMAELDAVVEGAIYKYILMPLKSEIYKSFITEHKQSGSLDILDHNIQLARAKTPQELGIKPNYIPPEGENLQKIREYFQQLERAYSPIEKLERLLDIVRTVYDTVVDQNCSRGQAVQSMGADDFLPMFIYVLVQCEMVDIEIEADYMWGLLEPSMLSGEGGYYLTTLSSAICVLKQFEQETHSMDTKGFLSVMVALGDGEEDRVVYKTLPVLPGMNAGDVSRILAHKMKIDHAYQYQLYLLSGEQETPIADNECPLELKESKIGPTKTLFGYKMEGRSVNWFPSSS